MSLPAAPFGDFGLPLNDEFSDTTQATYKPGLFEIINSPTRPGQRACRVQLQPVASFMDANHRCHFLGAKQAAWLGAMPPGTTFWWASSITLAADHKPATGWEISDEVHDGWHGPQQSFGGPAPFSRYHTGHEWNLVCRGGPMKTAANGGGSFKQAVWGGPKLTGPTGYGYKGGFAGGFPYQIELGKRYDWLYGFRLGPTETTGWFEAWCNGVAVVPRLGLPTCYLVEGGISDNFVMVGGYRQGTSGANAFPASFLLEAGRIFELEAEAKAYHAALVKGTTPPPVPEQPPPVVTPPPVVPDPPEGPVPWTPDRLAVADALRSASKALADSADAFAKIADEMQPPAALQPTLWKPPAEDG